MDRQINQPFAAVFLFGMTVVAILATTAFIYLADCQNKILSIGERLMGNDEELGAKLDASLANDERILAAVANLSGDFGGMASEIVDLRTQLASAGTTSPENLAKADALVEKSSDIATKLEALAAQYPPAPAEEVPPVADPADDEPAPPAPEEDDVPGGGEVTDTDEEAIPTP